MGQHTAATSDENEHATTNSRKRHLTATKENPPFTARNNTPSPQIPGYGTIMMFIDSYTWFVYLREPPKPLNEHYDYVSILFCP